HGAPVPSLDSQNLEPGSPSSPFLDLAGAIGHTTLPAGKYLASHHSLPQDSQKSSPQAFINPYIILTIGYQKM
ncbi:4809_t:CDS:2, partial [Acaulospora colombiana]